MILFINVLITNERLTHHQRVRGWLKNPPRINVYKYMLASLAVIPHWSKVIIHCKLDKEFENQADSLEDYTNVLFGKKKVSYYRTRNEYQNEWRKSLTEVFDDKDKLVWFLCNDDHIFIDSDLKSINEAINNLESQTEKMASFFFSHYPEGLKAVAQQGNQKTGVLGHYDGGNVDSIQLVTKKVLSRWFVENEDTTRFMPRPDWSTGFVKTDLTRHYVPLKECCRHFEGYPMVNIDINHCPPLDIPPGFFTDEIQIAYGHSEHPDPEKWVWFNPTVKDYRIVNPLGVDYKWVLDDVPLSWKKRVKKIETAPGVDAVKMLAARNEAAWTIANSRPNQPELVIDQNSVMAVAGRFRKKN
jgi:hypothetical protein